MKYPHNGLVSFQFIDRSSCMRQPVYLPSHQALSVPSYALSEEKESREYLDIDVLYACRRSDKF